jgi:hypothetical protein
MMQHFLAICVAALPILQTSALLDTTVSLNDDKLKLRTLEETIDIGACNDFSVMAGSKATCNGAANCEILGGNLDVSPGDVAGTSITGNFLISDVTTNVDSDVCAADGLAAWSAGTAKTGTAMLAEMGGLTFTPGVYTHGSAINIGLANPVVYLDAQGDKDAVFIFNAGTTLTTCAGSQIVLLNEAKSENVLWVLGTALTMGADSILVGTVLAGSDITIGTNGMIWGRVIAQSAVTCETACTVYTPGGHIDDGRSIGLMASYFFDSDGTCDADATEMAEACVFQAYANNNVLVVDRRLTEQGPAVRGGERRLTTYAGCPQYYATYCSKPGAPSFCAYVCREVYLSRRKLPEAGFTSLDSILSDVRTDCKQCLKDSNIDCLVDNAHLMCDVEVL